MYPINAKNSQIYNFKIFSHFSVTNIDCIVELLLSKMIKVFVYLKKENYIVSLLK